MSFSAAIDRMHTRQLATFGQGWTLHPDTASEAPITGIYRGPYQARSVGNLSVDRLDPTLGVKADDWAPLNAQIGDLLRGPEGDHQITDIQLSSEGSWITVTLRRLA